MTDDHTHRGDDVHSVEAAMKDANGGWQPIADAPTREGAEFLVFDGVGIWKAWRQDGEISGYEVDGCDLPCDGSPISHWMPLPAAPTEGEHLTPSEE
jgi:hypothetical protein